ncbi:Prolyl-tRNA synthetase, bacterial type [Actinomycetales bacterium JB111]|nr:Prolyl-tRNA synthetase, bacterial type [Actinomycetales bacterium JB111]
MLSTMSSFFLRTLREDPADAEIISHKLLVRAGYIRRAAPGIYTWLPAGLRVLGKVERIVREEMAAIGVQEVHFPALLPREPYEATGRWTEYGENLFRLQDRRKNDYLLAPTHEEMFTLLVKDLYSSYKDLPAQLYQVQTKYRDEARPRAGIVRGREFIMKDAYSFDIDADGLAASYELYRGAYLRIFERLGLPVAVVEADAGAMGGSRSEEFLFPTPAGEDTFVRSPGGYAANVEAVVTLVPEPVVHDVEPPAPTMVRTPGADTIDTLVTSLDAEAPRTDGRPWAAADTLKNLVLALSHPDGEREIVVVGIPGDRAMDEKRAEVAFAPAEVETATADDLRKHPELVPGYIGPRPEHARGDEKAVRYLLDPRVVDGSVWASGADEDGVHVVGLVAGRDFVADGTVEIADVRAGDPAPDGSGPLELARGMEMGHIFQLGTKYAEALGLSVLDPNGKAVTVTMGSYGLGVTRAVAAIVEATADEKGLSWPAVVAPFHVHVLATGKGEEIFAAAADLAGRLADAGAEVLYDDRPKVSAGVKFADAELIGVPYSLVVGRGLANGVVEVRNRATDEREELAPDDAAAEILRRLAADGVLPE